MKSMRRVGRHASFEIAGGATGAVLGAVVGGPVGALLGGTLGVVATKIVEAGNGRPSRSGIALNERKASFVKRFARDAGERVRRESKTAKHSPARKRPSGTKAKSAASRQRATPEPSKAKTPKRKMSKEKARRTN